MTSKVSKPILDENGIINVTNLFGSALSLGNGTSIAGGDVYVLQEIVEETTTSTKYEVVYYGKTEEENVILGTFNIDGTSNNSGSNWSSEYLFEWNDTIGSIAWKKDYSYYKNMSNRLAVLILKTRITINEC